MQRVKRKTYNNVLKAGKLIQKKGYGKQESLEMAVKLFDDLETLKNGFRGLNGYIINCIENNQNRRQ